MRSLSWPTNLLTLNRKLCKPPSMWLARQKFQWPGTPSAAGFCRECCPVELVTCGVNAYCGSWSQI